MESDEPTPNEVTVNSTDGISSESDCDKPEPITNTMRLLLPAPISEMTPPDRSADRMYELACSVEVPPSRPPEGTDQMAASLVQQNEEIVGIVPGLALDTSPVDLRANSVDDGTQITEAATTLVTEDSITQVRAFPVEDPALTTDCDHHACLGPTQDGVETVKVASSAFDETIATTSLMKSHESEDIGVISPFAIDDRPRETNALWIEEVAENSVCDTRLAEVQQAPELVEIAPASSVDNSPVETCAHSMPEQCELAEVSPSGLVGQKIEETRGPAASPVAEAVKTALTPDTDQSPMGRSGPLTEGMTATIDAVSCPIPNEKTAAMNVGPAPPMAQVVEVAPILSFPNPLRAHPTRQTKPERRFSAGSVNGEPASGRLLNFYGLSEQPFQVTPDPAYLYLSETHREALTSLRQGVQDLRGFMALIAEPGMGKTTLLNKLMKDLGESARTAFLFQTQCNSRELLRYLLGELGIKHAGMDAVTMHRSLNEILFQEMLHGRRFLLIVDEAQNLQESVLETIRLLSDFETDDRKLIQIVLAGQPQLVDTLMQPSLAQLRQRIAILCNLESLSAGETSCYVEHRLRAAGQTGEAIFTRDALELIAEQSEGTPRSINNLCFNALVSGYAQQVSTIDSTIVRKVAKKLDLSSLRRTRPSASAPAATYRPDEIVSPQDPTVRPTDLDHQDQRATDKASERPSKPSFTLRGKLTEKLQCRSWGKETEFRIQVSLERESPADIPVADRYYCCTFYVGEEHAALLKVGQSIQIKIEH